MPAAAVKRHISQTVHRGLVMSWWYLGASRLLLTYWPIRVTDQRGFFWCEGRKVLVTLWLIKKKKKKTVSISAHPKRAILKTGNTKLAFPSCREFQYIRIQLRNICTFKGPTCVTWSTWVTSHVHLLLLERASEVTLLVVLWWLYKGDEALVSS